MKAHTILALIAATVFVPHLAQAQGLDRLSIHGYLMQGFGISDGGTIFGIPEDGTTDYRNAALQFRYALSSKDYVTLQFSHRSLAQSTLVPPDEDNIEVDWAFYGRHIGDFEVKLGRVAIPAGIYNEIRDVGVLLPFYRAPFNFYLEGAFTSETIDGAVASYLAGADSPWNAEISAFGGEWNLASRTRTADSYVSENARATGAYGGQLWINTPLDGVRFGGGASRYYVPVSRMPGEWKEWHGSIDITLPLITAQSEIRKLIFENGSYLTYYAYLGIRPIPQLTLNAMADFADLSLEFPGYGILEWDYHDEYVLGANYALTSSVVLKLEGHKTDGLWPDAPVADGVTVPSVPVDFLILSVAVAF
jgi:hypothetical protein